MALPLWPCIACVAVRWWLCMAVAVAMHCCSCAVAVAVDVRGCAVVFMVSEVMGALRWRWSQAVVCVASVAGRVLSFECECVARECECVHASVSASVSVLHTSVSASVSVLHASASASASESVSVLHASVSSLRAKIACCTVFYCDSLHVFAALQAVGCAVSE